MVSFPYTRAPAAGPSVGPWLPWIPVAVGLAALYVPTWWDLWHGVWNTEEQGHGPLILAVSAYLFWQKRASLIDGVPAPNAILGSLMLVLGLGAYAIGRSQSILLFEVGSQIPVLLGTVFVLRGWKTLKALWFPIVFLVFMVPLPGVIVDAITGPLKQYVSVLAENILYFAGYPIARNGVVLSVGPYQLLVADACSGLNSMYSLAALGLLYLHLMDYKSWWRNGALLACILPIAFAANVMRVIILVLVTFHFGDEAGQGFLHGLAGMVLFAIALGLLFFVDFLLGLLFSFRHRLWREGQS